MKRSLKIMWWILAMAALSACATSQPKPPVKVPTPNPGYAPAPPKADTSIEIMRENRKRETSPQQP